MASISQSQTQKMLQKLSPQQIQMIKLLELPAIQLEQRIKSEIEENPALEEVSSSEDGVQRNISLDEYAKKDDIPSYKLYVNNYSRDDKVSSIPLSDGLTFYEYIKQQLSYQQDNDTINMIAEYIIGSLDRSGYLRRDTESIIDDIAFATGLEVSHDEVEYAIKLVQRLEPHGIGARDLRECLLLQLKHHPKTKHIELAKDVLENHFDAFVKKHFDKIVSRLGISDTDFRKVINVITTLSPKPANQYTENLQSEPTIQIVPDFILDLSNDDYEIILNKNNMPDVKVNGGYLDMLESYIKDNKRVIKLEKSEEEQDKEAATFIRQKVESAKWFISAIKQRNATLLLTMNTIFQFQRAYFEDGDETKLRPMILKDISDRTGLDVSTISRVVNCKYIQTHFGIYSLKYFFSEAMHTAQGEEVSSREIKRILSDCVENENKQTPLTDEALMFILQEKGYKIARRTVAKYREMLEIPVARLRRVF